MSLILKGIDLPSKGNYLDIAIFADGAVYTKTNCGEDTEKAQAVQIPKEHGKIGDLDALAAEIREKDIWGGLNYKRYIDDAPTILEAEE